MVGKIETLPKVENNLLEVVQVRNQSVISYSINPDGNKGGFKESLRQSLKSPVDEVLDDLYNTKEEIDLDNWIDEYKNYYDWKQKYFPFQLKPLGTVSNATKKRVSKLVETAVNGVLAGFDWKKDYKTQPYLTFVTCTLPAKQVHSDKVIKRSFTLFLENLVKTYNVKFYIWKAEAQNNGNIHFHVLVDRFIDHKIIRRLWNSQMSKLGYVQKYAEMMIERGFVYNSKSKKPRELQHLDYIINKKNGFKNPNSTDIHSLKNIKNVQNYIIKYMVKNEENKRPIIGRLWGCSRNVSFLKYPEFMHEKDGFEVMNLAEKHLKRIDGIEFVMIYGGNVVEMLKKHATGIFKRLKDYYKQINKMLYETQENNVQRCNERIGCIKIDGTENGNGYQATLSLPSVNPMAFG